MRPLKYVLALLPFLLLSATVTKDSARIAKDNEAFRTKINGEYADAATSPLTEEDLASFKGLPFFPIDTSFYVVADFERTRRAKAFEMQTTSDRVSLYREYGVATFWLKGKKHQLHIYQSERLKKMPEYKDYLFLPFKDASNGSSTYGGGRFIDLKISKDKTIVIDFNQAYNPYCAYNHKYSCPIPPQENHLDIAINAGVQYSEKEHWSLLKRPLEQAPECKHGEKAHVVVGLKISGLGIEFPLKDVFLVA